MAKYKLDDVCEFITDGTHQTPEYCDEGGVIFLSSKDVTERKINWDDVKHISNSLHEKLYKRLSPRKDDILLAKNGTTGVAAIVDKNEIFDVYVSLAVLRPLTTINPKYLLYAINSPVAKRQFDAGLKGVGVPNLHLNVIRETVINVVDKEEQEKICVVLDKIAGVIDKRKAELNELDNLIKARFVELFGNPEINDMHWDEHKLSDELSVIGGYAFKSDSFQEDGIPVLRIGNINAGVFRSINLVFWEKDDTLFKYLMYPGDMVMSLTGTVGKDDYGNVCILGSEYEMYYLNQRNAKLELKDGLDKYYLAELLKFPQIKKRLTGISRGVRQANISNKDILDLSVPIPPMKLQQQFADFVTQVDKSKVAVQRALDETQKLFDSLMQQYFG